MISKEIIIQTQKDTFSLPDNDIQKLIIEFIREQPVIAAYIVNIMDISDYNAAEQERFLWFGVMIWLIIRKTPGGINIVSEKNLVEAITENQEMQDRLANNFSVAFSQTVDYGEPELLQYILEVTTFSEEFGKVPCENDNYIMPPPKAIKLSLTIMALRIILNSFTKAIKAK